MKPILHEQRPADFNPQYQVVGCYLEINGKFLFLKYSNEKFQDKWGVPSFKIKLTEEPAEALIREFHEATKILITPEELYLVDKVYFKEPEDYVFYIYKVMLAKSLTTKMQLSLKYQEYKWVNQIEARNLAFVHGEQQAFEHCMRLTQKVERNKIVSSAYLILKLEDKYLLYLRQNSGFEDGNYGLVAGHIEHGESAKQAMIREAYEEANIVIQEKDLHFSHVSCRKSDRENIDIFFQCSKFSGEIKNNEPHKCAELKFYKITEFPNNVIDYIKNIIFLTHENINYSEIGW